MEEGLRGYWRRTAYRRLDEDGSGRRRRRRRAELGGGGSGGRRRWFRIKSAPRLGFRFLRAASPKRILARIRDAYVRMMLGFASSPALAGGYGFGFGYGGAGFGAPASEGFRRPQKEYDEKVLVEIYKSIIAAQGPLIAAANVGRR